MRPRLCTASQVLLVVLGVLLSVLGAVDPQQSGLLLLGPVLVVPGVLWRVVTRDSAEPDVVDGPVPLGDGRVVEGRRITHPRSKRIAVGLGGLLMGALPAGIVLRAVSGGERPGIVPLLVFGAVGLLFLWVGATRLWQSRRAEWLGLSRAGITLRGFGGHFTVPWDDVDRVAATTFANNRCVAVWADLDRAVGDVGGVVRRTAPRAGSDLPALFLPASLFDLPVEDVAAAAQRWQRAADGPRWPSGATTPPADGPTHGVG